MAAAEGDGRDAVGARCLGVLLLGRLDALVEEQLHRVGPALDQRLGVLVGLERCEHEVGDAAGVAAARAADAAVRSRKADA